jgi:ATP-dependent protease HslVU (ClpYQ) peptidase subunit
MLLLLRSFFDCERLLSGLGESDADAEQPWARMTAEIAIMNKQAIVLAADSAVTVGRRKVWKTANKLFSLSPYNDIAIMAYGSGDFVGFPWETIVKSFRLLIGKKRYRTVQECADEFIEYLKKPLFSAALEEQISVMVCFIEHLEMVHKRFPDFKTKKEFREKLTAEIEKHVEKIKNLDEIPLGITLKEFRTEYHAMIVDLVKEEFKEHIPQTIMRKLVELLHMGFTRMLESDYSTGVVVAGFGSEEFFPALAAYKVDGKHKGRLRSWQDKGNSHDCNGEETSHGVIIPFGQADIAILFLEGIISQHTRWIRRTLKRLLDDKADSVIEAYVADADEKIVERNLQRAENTTIVRDLDKEFEAYRDKSLVQPVMKVVATLPKEEMADMAEALVELTSLRRRVDSPLESVGGPTDVTVISKGDGLVWIKRKHYFDSALNSDFHARKALQNQGV